MKTYKYILAIFLLGLMLTACEKETEGVSKITYYATFDINDGPLNMLVLDSTGTWIDPGVVAMINGEDITDQVKTEGSVNLAATGIYPVKYSAVNEDGFPASVERRVVVYNPAPSAIPSGVYITDKSSNRNITTVYNDEFTVLIYQIAPGKFYISDFLGGYYEQRAGYGADYAAKGEFTLSESNELTLVSSSVKGWGDALSGLSGASFDPVTNTLKWTAEYAGFNFNIIAKPL